ncbi:MAG: hypothetical protein P8166_12555 [Candidatus Thiodiazotropha sp.]
MKWKIAAVSLFVPFVAYGGVYKCETEDGIVYSDTACEETLPIDTGNKTDFGNAGTGRGGLRQGEREALREFKRKNEARQKAMSESAKKTISYSDRLRLRELRIRRNDLQSQLHRGNLSVGSGIAVREEIRSIDREEQEIRSRYH